MWKAAETSTHQDHVIAHVIGASPLGHFIWDETAYLLLDIGFIWNVYLDGEMGLLPQPLVVGELEADDDVKDALRVDIDLLSQQQDFDRLSHFKRVPNPSPIQSVEFFETQDGRRLVLNFETGSMVLETSFITREIRIERKE